MRNLSAFVDQEGRAFDAHIFPAIHAFFNPDAVSLARLSFLVGYQREIQVIFLLEFIVLLDAVFRQAEDKGVPGAEFFQMIPESAGFLCAAGRVVLWIKIEDNLLSFNAESVSVLPPSRGA